MSHNAQWLKCTTVDIDTLITLSDRMLYMYSSAPQSKNAVSTKFKT